jgi:hypothetical protein
MEQYSWIEVHLSSDEITNLIMDHLYKKEMVPVGSSYHMRAHTEHGAFSPNRAITVTFDKRQIK